MFSGAYERASPQTFEVEKVRAGGKADYLRVDLKLTAGVTACASVSVRVAVLISRENRRLFVNDIIYLRDENHLTEDRLSEYMLRHCQGLDMLSVIHVKYKQPNNDRQRMGCQIRTRLLRLSLLRIEHEPLHQSGRRSGQYLAEPQSLDFYSYALNNPLRYNDPDGHDAGCGGGRTSARV